MFVNTNDSVGSNQNIAIYWECTTAKITGNNKLQYFKGVLKFPYSISNKFSKLYS